MSDWWEALDKNLDWREQELAALKLKIVEDMPKPPAPPGPAYKALLRAIWAMLYAHYEGFWSFAMSLYLERLEQIGVARQNCVDVLAEFSLQQHLREFRRGVPDAKCIEFFKTHFPRLLASRIDFHRNKSNEYVLKGYSNLWPEALADSVDSAGIRRTLIQHNDARLYLLVDRRNQIAHGKDTPVADLAEYQKYENHVFDVMHELAIHIIDSIVQREYMHSSARSDETARMAYRLWQERGGNAFDNWTEAERRLGAGEKP